MLENVNNITQVNLNAAKGATSALLSDLIVQAGNPANTGFASAESNYTSTLGAAGNVYGIVQCWRDISIKDCTTCSSKAMTILEDCCYTKRGARLSVNCKLRYEIYSFFNPGDSVLTDAPSTHIASLPPNTTVHQTSIAPLPSNTPLHQTPIAPLLATTPVHQKNSRKFALILGIVGGIIVTLVGSFLAIRSKVKSTVSSQPVTQDEDTPETRIFMKKQIAFSLETLIEATGDFSDNNKLGEGGFGTVYKGMTREGKEIAVKKLSARSAQGKREFMNEVELVANIQHRNLVNLLGCCTEGSEMLLVYEYLQNKSLDAFLFDREKCTRLNWQKRFSIIIGIARGLLYLHELDENLNPKIADFGLARLFPDNETYILSKVAGTYGYMAPEYAMAGQLSVKVDVYSFGVLLLEIVSGRKNTDINLSKEKQSLSLVEWAWRSYKGGNALNIVDSVVVRNCPEEQVSRSIQIGLLCTQADPDVRPIISHVITMISTNSMPLPNPSRPAFVNMTSQSLNMNLIPRISSRNETSTSTMDAR